MHVTAHTLGGYSGSSDDTRVLGAELAVLIERLGSPPKETCVVLPLLCNLPASSPMHLPCWRTPYIRVIVEKLSQWHGMYPHVAGSYPIMNSFIQIQAPGVANPHGFCRSQRNLETAYCCIY